MLRRRTRRPWSWRCAAVMVVSSTVGAAIATAQGPDWSAETRDRVTVRYTMPDGGIVPSLEAYIMAGRQAVERFFGLAFPDSFVVTVYPSRDLLDAHWREAWGAPGFESECWMVASGDRELDLLSPRVWREQACEHDPADSAAVSALVTHELVHVFHTQVHPQFDADAMEPIGWFAEGVAVLGSGQLDPERIAQAKEAVETGQTPAALAQAWSGPYRYAVSGTLVLYLDHALGRAKLTALLEASTQQEILEQLGLTEATLLERWAQFVRELAPRG